MSLLIGKHINKSLSGNKSFVDIVGDRLFPLVAVEGTELPFVVYQRSGINESGYSKDGYGEDVVNCQIVIVSEDYDQSLDIAQIVRDTLENSRSEYPEFSVSDSEMTSASEDMVSDAFVQVLTFTFTTEK